MASTTAVGLGYGTATGRAGVVARRASAWVFLLPTIVFFVGWQLYPIVRVLWMSFTDFHFLRTSQSVSWVGIQNYLTAFADPVMWTGLERAAIFTALFLPGMIFIPMLLA